MKTLRALLILLGALLGVWLWRRRSERVAVPTAAERAAWERNRDANRVDVLPASVSVSWENLPEDAHQ